MESPSRLVFLLISLLTSLLLQFSDSATLVVDGVSEWRNPSVHIGDCIIFKHKNNNYKLYIFQNRGDFNLCNFTQATLLTKPNSNSFTWHPSRPGFFYFSFNNDSTKPCQQGQKLTIKVSSLPPAPENSATAPGLSPVAAPAPVSGGVVSSSPAFSWPFQPRESELAPSPAPSTIFPATSPSLLPEKGDGIPFINSNPAVPLPTGEVDSATIRPLPTSGHGGQVVGLFAVQMALCFVVLLLLL
ncbi:early nodulin-like protein 18 [Actinidia eriantha]|uniref:early nodulin-like protein 18 n=1 Tax=Actinidia eriantha TaxID=165200 RepID=UPI0025853713|nr:early nodulin-like protein 18 [Actinidia eriantha]